MKRLTVLIISLFLLALSACSGDPSPTRTDLSVEPANSPSQTESSTPTSSKGERNSRGQLIKEVGDIASSTNQENGKEYFAFKVTSIKLAECDTEWFGDQGTIPLSISVEVEVGSDLTDMYYPGSNMSSLSLSNEWIGYAPNGTRMNNTIGGGCYSDYSRLLPQTLNAGEKAVGEILVAVTSETGEIAFQPRMVNGGWVWKYPTP